VSGGAVLEIGADLGGTQGDLSNPVGGHGSGINITFWGDSGLSAYGADRVVGFRTDGTGSLQSLTWGANNFLTNPNNAGDGNYRLLLSSEHSNAKLTLQNNIALGSLMRTVDVADGSAEVDAVLSGVLSGAGGMVKAGEGTLSISGPNTYTGGTVVSAGTLLVDGDSSAATGPVAVNSGGTLGGTGTVGGATSVNAGAFLAPGTSIGMLTFDDQLTLQPGSTLLWQFLEAGDAGHDYDSITGPKLVLPDSGSVNLSILGLTDHPDYVPIVAGDSFTLFHGDVYQGAEELALASGSDVTGLFAFEDNFNWCGTWQVTANDPAFGLPGNLILTAVPEPGAALLVLSAMACGLLAWPRRKRR
jgi:autotransporter-associated beta strand protein